MNKQSKIFVAGAAGMVGSAIVRRLLDLGFKNIVGSFHSHFPAADTFLRHDQETEMSDILKLIPVDLTQQAAVEMLFKAEKPEYVFMAAAKVGGIQANNSYPAQFIYENLAIQNNIIYAAFQNNVDRLLFLGSSCIYPKLAPQPMKEKHLLSGFLEPTNEPYAIAKIAGIKMCEAFNRQYGTKFMAVMPTNLYGINDNFDLETSHVLPALIRKFHSAKTEANPDVVIWGSGTPRREFLHVDDLADASISVMNLDDKTASNYFFSYPDPCFVNVGSGKDLTIRELAEIICQVVGFKGDLVFDTSKPDGTPRKLLDVSRLHQLGWKPKIALFDGIQQTYQWYRKYIGSIIS